MKALVYHGPGKRAWEEVPDAIIQDPTDAVVRVDAVTICGTDLHILGGDVPEVAAGRILGHEAVGTVTAIGSGVQRLAVGDRVLVSCITSCGSCRFCRDGSYGQCLGGGGWILGHLIDGTQAEYVRVPFADNSTHAVPDGVTDDEMIMLADILPTSYEVGVLNGTGPARRCRGYCRSRSDRAGSDPDCTTVQPQSHRVHRPGRLPAGGGSQVRCRHRDQQWH
jgi:alcohol dehydrogenase